jgi:hypothetical protein
MMEWESFFDESYYDMWAVRPVGDTNFNSPRLFHFDRKDDAEKFKELCEKASVATPRPDKADIELAVKFAQWLYNNRWFTFENGKWRYTFEMGTAISQASYNKNFVKTTEQLFNLFMLEKERR